MALKILVLGIIMSCIKLKTGCSSYVFYCGFLQTFELNSNIFPQNRPQPFPCVLSSSLFISGTTILHQFQLVNDYL